MPENDRLKKVIFFLFSQGIVDSQLALAAIVGYNESYLSQVVSGSKNLSNKLIKKICDLENNINPDYLLGNSDEILKVREPNDGNNTGKTYGDYQANRSNIKKGDAPLRGIENTESKPTKTNSHTQLNDEKKLLEMINQLRNEIETLKKYNSRLEKDLEKSEWEVAELKTRLNGGEPLKESLEAS